MSPWRRRAVACTLALGLLGSPGAPPAGATPAAPASAALAPPTTSAPAAAATAEPPAGTVPENTGRALGAAGMMTGSLGLFAGLWLFLHSEAVAKRVATQCVDTTIGTEWVCPRSVQDDLDRGRLEQRWGAIGLIGGGALIGAGLTLWLVYAPPAQPAAGTGAPGLAPRSGRVAAGLGPDGVFLWGRF